MDFSTGDSGDGFNLPAMWSGQNFAAPADPGAPTVAEDDEQNKKFDPNNPLAYFQNQANNPFTYSYQGPRDWMAGAGDSADPTMQHDAGYILSSNNRRLDLNQNNVFSDVFDQPGGGGERDKVGVNYQYDPTTGTSKAISANTFYSPSDWVNTGRPIVQALAPVVTAGLGGYFGAAGDLGAAGDVGGSAEAATSAGSPYAYMGPGSPGAGAAGEGLPSLLDTVGQGALRGAVTNGGLTAAKGGDGSDILKGAAIGGLTGGIGGGISYANPAQYAGINDPQYGRYFNSAVSSGVNSSLTGGNVGDALKGSAIGSGVNFGANGVANWANSPGGNMSYDMPDVGTIGGTMQDQYGENSSTMGGATIPAQVAANTEQNPYLNQQSTQPQGNPLKSMVQQLLGGSSQGFSGNGNGQVNGNGLGNMTGSLMGLYSAWQKRKQLGNLQSGLEGLYGQDSPYAQQLRNTLARHDAASGRRSQVGPREVELQARLAGLNAQMAPTLSNIIGQRNNTTNMGMYNLAQLFGNTGPGQRVGNYLGDWGQSLYNQYLGSPMAGANVGPQLND